MNPLLEALRAGRPQIGLWQALAYPYSAELCATAGFDWMLFDGEHGPNTITTMLGQLQAVAPYPVEPVARLPYGDTVTIKQYMDIGFRSLLVPMVETAAHAASIAAATRYPTRGVRGVASGIVRASRFGTIPDYLATAHEEVCLFVQIETPAAMSVVAEIAAVDGVDGVFFGPSDLAAGYGFLGAPRTESVRAAMTSGIAAVLAAGKVAGAFALDADDAASWVAAGARFVSVGSDIGVLAAGVRGLHEAARASVERGLGQGSS